MKIIENRKPIWKAISEFYIDTELSENDYNRILEIFIKSEFDMKTIKEIDLFEVFPSVNTNILSPTSEWAGFNEDWLYSICTKNYKRKNNMFHVMKCKILNKTIFNNYRNTYWKRIQKKLIDS